MSFLAPSVDQPKEKKVANIGGDDVSTNEEGVPVPYLAGVGKIALRWITRVYNPEIVPVKSSGSSKFAPSQNSGQFKYFGSLAGLICFGPLDVIYAIIIDNNIVWPAVKNIEAGWTTGGLFLTSDVTTITVPKFGTARLYRGTETQNPSADAVLVPRGTVSGGIDPSDPSTWPNTPAAGAQQTFDGMASGDANPKKGHYELHPDYLGIALMVFERLHFGEGRNAAPSVEVIVGRRTSYFGGGFSALDLGGVNPIGPLYESLTNGRYGSEFADADLLQASFNTVADATPDIVISPVVTQKTKHRDFINQLVKYYDGFVRRNGALIEAGYFQHGNLGTSFPHLDSDDLTEEPELKSTGYGGTSNYFAVKYNNRHRYFKRDVERYTDEANREAVDETRIDEMDLPWIVDPILAQKYAVEWGQIQSLPVHSGTIAVKRERVLDTGIKVGGRFYIDDTALNFSILMRCLELEWPKDKDGSVKVTCESERGVWPQIYYPPPADKDQDFNFGPQPITHYRVVELPRDLRSDVSAAQIAVLALRPNRQCVGFRVWVSADDATYTNVTPENQFAAFGKLAADYSAATSNPDTTTGFNVYLYGADQDQVTLQSDQAREDGTLLVFFPNGEIGSGGVVTALGDGLFNVKLRRALYNTAQQAHTAGDEVWFAFRSALTINDHASFIAGATVHFKLQTHAQILDLDLADVTSFAYTFGAPATLARPSVSPGTGTYSAYPFDATLAIDGGLTARYSQDGTEVRTSSQEWPKSGGVYVVLAITGPCTLRIKGYSADGSATPEVIVVYTQVASGGGTPTCAAVTFGFSGTQHLTTGNLSMFSATAGATIKFQKNGGAVTTYTGAVAAALNDVFVAHAEHSGFSNSPDSSFDNTYTPPAGGGGGGGGGGGVGGGPPHHQDL